MCHEYILGNRIDLNSWQNYHTISLGFILYIGSILHSNMQYPVRDKLNVLAAYGIIIKQYVDILCATYIRFIIYLFLIYLNYKKSNLSFYKCYFLSLIFI